MTSARSIDDEFLRPAEDRELTGVTKPDDQVAALTADGTPFRRRRTDKRILGRRFHVRQRLSGKLISQSGGGVRLDLVK